MFFTQEPLQLEYPPVDGTGFSPNEVEELLSIFQPSSMVSSFAFGSEESNRMVHPIDEKKRRRMISNRESARRSRWRRKTHVENLNKQVTILESENQKLKNRLGLLSNRSYMLWRENNRLRSESLALWAKLSYLHDVLVAMHASHANN